MFGTSSTVENAPSVLSLWGQVPRATLGYALGLEFGRFLATAERSNRIAQAAVAEAMAPLVLW